MASADNKEDHCKEQHRYFNYVFHGLGITNDCECIYIGQFKNGLRHGYGRLFDAYNLFYYEGSFMRGVYHGEGKRAFKYGRVEEGMFEDGDYVGS